MARRAKSEDGKRRTPRRGNGSGGLFRRSPSGPWWGSYYRADGTRRARSTGTTNKADAERIVRGWVERVALEREGLVAPEDGSPLDRHAAASIESHVVAFEAAKRASLKAKGKPAENRHLDETVKIVRDTATACGWSALRDIDAEAFEKHLHQRQEPTPDAEGNTPRAWTPRTAHKHATALRIFTRWCIKDGRLASDPLARIEKPTPTRQRERRYLLVDEWRWLRDVTEHGPERMGMTGRARRLLYELAIQTGLRAGELRSLTRTSLSLDGDRPYVLLTAAQTKNSKPARQYVKPETADLLRSHVARLMPTAPVLTMPRREHVAAMLRDDLKAAREAWLADAGDDADLRVKREGSDFLRAQNHAGQWLDFHSLRHTCGTWAALGGARPKAIQALMRHASITLTLDTYGHLLPDELAETVATMPTMGEAVPLRMTGTTNAPEEAQGVYTAVCTAATRMDASQCDQTPKAQPRSPVSERETAVFEARRTGLEPATTGSTVRGNAQNPLQNKGAKRPPLPLYTAVYTAGTPDGPSDAPLDFSLVAGLDRVKRAWPALPADVRAAVLALIDGAAPEARSDRLSDSD